MRDNTDLPCCKEYKKLYICVNKECLRLNQKHTSCFDCLARSHKDQHFNDYKQLNEIMQTINAKAIQRIKFIQQIKGEIENFQTEKTRQIKHYLFYSQNQIAMAIQIVENSVAKFLGEIQSQIVTYNNIFEYSPQTHEFIFDLLHNEKIYNQKLETLYIGVVKKIEEQLQASQFDLQNLLQKQCEQLQKLQNRLDAVENQVDFIEKINSNLKIQLLSARRFQQIQISFFVVILICFFFLPNFDIPEMNEKMNQNLIMQSILEQKYYKLDDSFNQTFKFQKFINQKAFKLLRKASWLVWSTRIQLAPIMTEILIKENQNQRFASPGKQSRLFEMRAVDKESLDVSNNLTLMWLKAAEPHNDLSEESEEFNTLSVFKQFDLAKLIGKILKNTNFSFLRYFVQPKKQLRYFQQDEIDYVKKNVFRNSIICIGGHKNNDDQFFQVLACDYSQEVFAETNSFVEARKSEQSDSLFWYYVRNQSIGFSPSQDINLSSSIDNVDPQSQERLSFSLNHSKQETLARVADTYLNQPALILYDLRIIILE